MRQDFWCSDAAKVGIVSPRPAVVEGGITLVFLFVVTNWDLDLAATSPGSLRFSTISATQNQRLRFRGRFAYIFN
jgi:hypothetical protein